LYWILPTRNVGKPKKIENCELNIKRFPGAVYRIVDPKIAVLIFSSGKVVLTGLRNHQALAERLMIIQKSLRDTGVDTPKSLKLP
jgi:transcription initiation factor TFIID TATA-box-binding protein